MTHVPHTLILGGARSGKSGHAQNLAESVGPKRLYVATAQAFDAEMTERIEKHQADRKTGWTTYETQTDLITPLRDPGDADVILIDCLTLWLFNVLFAEHDIREATTTLCHALSKLKTPVIFVSNEVGMGLVPDTPLGRRFRDAQGRLNQDIAKHVETVHFIAAGLPIALKGRS